MTNDDWDNERLKEWVDGYWELLCRKRGKTRADEWVQETRKRISSQLKWAVDAHLQPVPPGEPIGITVSDWYLKGTILKHAYKVRCSVAPCRGLVGYVLVVECFLHPDDHSPDHCLDPDDPSIVERDPVCDFFPRRGWRPQTVPIPLPIAEVRVPTILRRSGRMIDRQRRGYPLTGRRPGSAHGRLSAEEAEGIGWWDPWGPRPGARPMESQVEDANAFPQFIECSDCPRLLKVTHPLRD